MMPEISLAGLVIVAAITFLVPLGLGLVPSLRLPSVVLEIIAGIVIGPAVLGLVEVDLPLQVLALLGLAFLLFFGLIAEIGPARATVITYVNPAVAVIVGALFLGEPLTFRMVGAMVVILAGVAIAQSDRWKRVAA